MSSCPLVAASEPLATAKNSNLNQESRSEPVILKRGADSTSTPDISDIFDGYSFEELVQSIPHIPEAIHAQKSQNSIDDDGLVILELRLGKNILNDAMIAYRQGDTLLLPIDQLSDALQFPIQIDLDTKRAEGWFSEEDKTFQLDAAKQRAAISGKVEALSSEQFSLRDDDIFVDSRLLSEWFSIDFDISYLEQIIAVKGKNNMVLPAERFAKRENARDALRLKSVEDSSHLPIIREPYHLATLPFSDVSLTATMDDRSTPHTRAQGSVLMNGDLLYMHQSSYVTYDKNTGLGDARITLSRKDPEGQFFQADEYAASTWLGETANEWKLTDVTLGDLVSRQLPLTMLNQNGRGIMVTNQPLDRSSRYDRTTIRGDIQPDWDVELYRNDELLAFQRSNTNGRYEFDDVPLLSGLNIIRLVFYGPFGQTREEIQRLLVNPNIAEQGKSYARLTAMQQSKSLLGNTTGTSAFASNFTVGLNNQNIGNAEGASRFAFEYEYGVWDNLAIYAQATHTPLTDTITNNALTLGLGGVWEDIYGRVDIARDDANGQAVQITTQTNIMGLNLSLEYQQYDDFLSDYTENINDPVNRRTTVRVDGSVALPILPPISLGVAAARTQYVSGRVRDEINQRTTTNLFGAASLNHNVTLSRDQYPSATETEQMRGNILLNLPAFGAFVRGGVNYTLKPDTAVESAAVAVDYSFSEDLVWRNEVLKQMSGEKLNSINSSLTKRFESIAVGFSAGADDKGNMLAGISLNFAIGQEPETGKIRAYGDLVSSSGMVSARTYTDTNHNQLRDADEPAISDSDYMVNGGMGSSRNQDHIGETTLVKYLPTYTATVMTINPSSLDDPFLLAADQGTRVIARPGVPVMLDFSIQHAADVEGLVTITRNGETKEAANVLVEAVDKNGVVIRSVRSAFDGVYLLELLPTDSYTIRVSSEQSERLGFKSTTSQHLTITGGEEFIQDINLAISR